MSFSNAIRWYIKWWWTVGIAWFVSFFILIFWGFGIIGKFLNFLHITISNVIFKNIIIIVYFPGYIFTLVFKGLDTGYFGILPMFIFYLITCYILAIIFKLLLGRKNKEQTTASASTKINGDGKKWILVV